MHCSGRAFPLGKRISKSNSQFLPFQLLQTRFPTVATILHKNILLTWYQYVDFREYFDQNKPSNLLLQHSHIFFLIISDLRCWSFSPPLLGITLYFIKIQMLQFLLLKDFALIYESTFMGLNIWIFEYLMFFPQFHQWWITPTHFAVFAFLKSSTHFILFH